MVKYPKYPGPEAFSARVSGASAIPEMGGIYADVTTPQQQTMASFAQLMSTTAKYVDKRNIQQIDNDQKMLETKQREINGELLEYQKANPDALPLTPQQRAIAMQMDSKFRQEKLHSQLAVEKQKLEAGDESSQFWANRKDSDLGNIMVNKIFSEANTKPPVGVSPYWWGRGMDDGYAEAKDRFVTSTNKWAATKLLDEGRQAFVDSVGEMANQIAAGSTFDALSEELVRKRLASMYQEAAGSGFLNDNTRQASYAAFLAPGQSEDWSENFDPKVLSDILGSIDTGSGTIGDTQKFVDVQSAASKGTKAISQRNAEIANDKLLADIGAFEVVAFSSKSTTADAAAARDQVLDGYETLYKNGVFDTVIKNRHVHSAIKSWLSGQISRNAAGAKLQEDAAQNDAVNGVVDRLIGVTQSGVLTAESEAGIIQEASEAGLPVETIRNRFKLRLTSVIMHLSRTTPLSEVEQSRMSEEQLDSYNAIQALSVPEREKLMTDSIINMNSLFGNNVGSVLNEAAGPAYQKYVQLVSNTNSATYQQDIEEFKNSADGILLSGFVSALGKSHLASALAETLANEDVPVFNMAEAVVRSNSLGDIWNAMAKHLGTTTMGAETSESISGGNVKPLGLNVSFNNKHGSRLDSSGLLQKVIDESLPWTNMLAFGYDQFGDVDADMFSPTLKNAIMAGLHNYNNGLDNIEHLDQDQHLEALGSGLHIIGGNDSDVDAENVNSQVLLLQDPKGFEWDMDFHDAWTFGWRRMLTSRNTSNTHNHPTKLILNSTTGTFSQLARQVISQPGGEDISGPEKFYDFITALPEMMGAPNDATIERIATSATQHAQKIAEDQGVDLETASDEVRAEILEAAKDEARADEAFGAGQWRYEEDGMSVDGMYGPTGVNLAESTTLLEVDHSYTTFVEHPKPGGGSVFRMVNAGLGSGDIGEWGSDDYIKNDNGDIIEVSDGEMLTLYNLWNDERREFRREKPKESRVEAQFGSTENYDHSREVIKESVRFDKERGLMPVHRTATITTQSDGEIRQYRPNGEQPFYHTKDGEITYPLSREYNGHTYVLPRPVSGQVQMPGWYPGGAGKESWQTKVTNVLRNEDTVNKDSRYAYLMMELATPTHFPWTAGISGYDFYVNKRSGVLSYVRMPQSVGMSKNDRKHIDNETNGFNARDEIYKLSSDQVEDLYKTQFDVSAFDLRISRANTQQQTEARFDAENLRKAQAAERDDINYFKGWFMDHVRGEANEAHYLTIHERTTFLQKQRALLPELIEWMRKDQDSPEQYMITGKWGAYPMFPSMAEYRYNMESMSAHRADRAAYRNIWLSFARRDWE